MPDHVHLLIRKHKGKAEQMIENIQELVRLRLSASGLRAPGHPVWARSGWKVFPNHPDDIRRTIRYVNDNTLQRRMPPTEDGLLTTGLLPAVQCFISDFLTTSVCISSSSMEKILYVTVGSDLVVSKVSCPYEFFLL